MHTQTLVTAFGCLLHDVGKLVVPVDAPSSEHSAAGVSWLRKCLNGVNAKPVLDCVRYHHEKAIRNAKLPSNSPAYIACLANQIAADRAEQPLQAKQQHLLQELKAGLLDLALEETWLNPLLCLLESCTSSVFDNTEQNECLGISFFDHLKMTAAVGCCVSEWLLAQGVSDYRKALLKEAELFCRQPVFLLYSAEFSGVQKFICTVSHQNPLRSMKGRTFFLELAMEHYVNELLTLCGLSRSNLLYSGGGHCCLLLPNTEQVKAAIQSWAGRFQEWLIEQFGVSLYLANAWIACTANDLCDRTDQGGDAPGLFHRVSHQIEQQKAHPYSAAQIRLMNRPEPDSEGRECRICGRVDTLSRSQDGKAELCRWCQLFEMLSDQVQRNAVPVVMPTEGEEGLVLPAAKGKTLFRFTDRETAVSLLKHKEPNDIKTPADTDQNAVRLGVCRMDVDDWEEALLNGFQRESKQPHQTLFKAAAFSRQLSWFFRCHVNELLNGLRVSVVYSGVDDVFFMGEWDDVVEGAMRIRGALRTFSNQTLTISGGIALFAPPHPIQVAVRELAELEAVSKAHKNEETGAVVKDAITLFVPDERYCFSWEEFSSSVMGEKKKVLSQFFTDENEKANSFLYLLTDLLRETEPGERINLARYAYTLARLEPSKYEPSRAIYERMAQKLYQWALEEKDRKALLMAISIHRYRNRTRKER